MGGEWDVANSSGRNTKTQWGRFQVFAGRALFSNQNNIAGAVSMLEGRRPDRPDHPALSDRLWKLIHGCWKGDAARRMTIVEVVSVLEGELAKRCNT